MSAHWRAMVDSHATTLNAHQSMILSFIADGADARGVSVPDVDTVAWLARCNASTVRKTIEDLVAAGMLTKTKARTYQLADIECPSGCPIHPDPDDPASYIPIVVQKTREVGPSTNLPSFPNTIFATTITCALERYWRDRFKSEPTPGVLRHMVVSVLSTDQNVTGFETAFAEYLRRLKDPMYLNLQKFASTWRVYLEPEKGGNVADQNAKDFAAVFAPTTETVSEFQIEGGL